MTMFLNRENPRAHGSEWTFLCQAGDEHEANIIESLLDSEGIPVLRKYREAGDYLRIYMGMTNFGIDIFVPGSVIDQAQGLLENNPPEDE